VKQAGTKLRKSVSEGDAPAVTIHKGGRILIADDDAASRNLLRKRLE
jgi:hypothetical protein